MRRQFIDRSFADDDLFLADIEDFGYANENISTVPVKSRPASPKVVDATSAIPGNGALTEDAVKKLFATLAPSKPTGSTTWTTISEPAPPGVCLDDEKPLDLAELRRPARREQNDKELSRKFSPPREKAPDAINNEPPRTYAPEKEIPLEQIELKLNIDERDKKRVSEKDLHREKGEKRDNDRDRDRNRDTRHDRDNARSRDSGRSRDTAHDKGRHREREKEDRSRHREKEKRKDAIKSRERKDSREKDRSVRKESTDKSSRSPAYSRDSGWTRLLAAKSVLRERDAAHDARYSQHAHRGDVHDERSHHESRTVIHERRPSHHESRADVRNVIVIPTLPSSHDESRTVVIHEPRPSHDESRTVTLQHESRPVEGPSMPPHMLPPPVNTSVPPPYWPGADYQQAAQAQRLAVEKEELQQKLTFASQRSHYMLKRQRLVNELSLVVEQGRQMPHMNGALIEENRRLQEDIGQQIKSLNNVVEMLTDLIGDSKDLISEPDPLATFNKLANESSGFPTLEAPSLSNVDASEPSLSRSKARSRSSSSSSSSSSGESSSSSSSGRSSKGRKKSKRKKKKKSKKSGKDKQRDEKCNLAFYDTCKHWCRHCKVFPPSAKDYLVHLHTPEHRQVLQDRQLSELPWHDDNVHKERVVQEDLPTKRTPIKGLQFFVPTRAWYCKLCQVFMGDLHCASLHLKSQDHNDNFEVFVKQNPNWEAVWNTERDKAEAQDQVVNKIEEKLALQQKIEDEMKQRLRMLEANLQPVETKRRTHSKEKKKRRNSSSSDDARKKKRKSKSKKQKDDKKSAPKKDIVSYLEEEAALNKIRMRSPEPSTNPILDAKALVESLKRTEPNTSAAQSDASKNANKHTILLPESLALENLLESAKPKRVRTISDYDYPTRAVAPKVPDKKHEVPSKTKFGFIGRMPFAKKKSGTSDAAKRDGRKEQTVPTPDPTPPPPPVISLPPPLPPSQIPVPPVLTAKTRVAVAKEILNRSQSMLQQTRANYAPMDPVLMEVDDQRPRDSPPRAAPPSPPKIRLPPEITRNLGKQTAAVPLPREFRETLNIIYPVEDDEEKPKRIVGPMPKTRSPTPPLPPVPPPPAIDRPAKIKAPPPPDIDQLAKIEVPPPPGINRPAKIDEIEVPPAPPPPNNFTMTDLASDRPAFFPFDEEDEMALLGIDKEDMAAQKF